MEEIETFANYIPDGSEDNRLKRGQIYDCFTFFNELDLLELRLNILKDSVDFFVIAEGNKTHTGEDKDFVFEQNRIRFKEFEDKIIYIKVDNFPNLEISQSDSFGNKWLYENFQRDALMRGLTKCKPDDIVIISDCDEIINPKIIKKYKTGICSLKQFNIYYKYNTLNISDLYSKKAKICRYKNLINPNQKLENIEYCAFSKEGLPTYLRFCKGQKIYNAGWHFSYIADTSDIIKKRQSIVEQQFNNKKNMSFTEIEKLIESGRDILERDDRYVNIKLSEKFLPNYLIEHQDKYSKFINYNNQISYFTALLHSFMYKIITIQHEENNINNRPILKICGLKIKLKKDKECFQL